MDDSDDTRIIRAKVTGQICTLDETLQDTLPALLALLDAVPDDSAFLQLDPPQRCQRTREALKRVLLHESQVQPLLLVFEDLHWIDTETQALLDRLAQALPAMQGPATVQAILAARIDRLPPEEKRLLQTAAVVGTEPLGGGASSLTTPRAP